VNRDLVAFPAGKKLSSSRQMLCADGQVRK
jgi:hypothetical protein